MLECLKALSHVGALQCIECLKLSLNVKKPRHRLVHLRYAQTSFELPRLPRPQAVEVFLLLLVGGRHADTISWEVNYIQEFHLSIQRQGLEMVK